MKKVALLATALTMLSTAPAFAGACEASWVPNGPKDIKSYTVPFESKLKKGNQRVSGYLDVKTCKIMQGNDEQLATEITGVVDSSPSTKAALRSKRVAANEALRYTRGYEKSKYDVQEGFAEREAARLISAAKATGKFPTN